MAADTPILDARAVHVEAGRRAKKHIDVVGETEWLEQLDPDASTLRAFVGSVAGFDELLANRAEEEKQLFFNGVARDFYRID